MNWLSRPIAQEALDWPRQISRIERIPVATGHRSFLYSHCGDFRQLFTTRIVKVRGHALLVPLPGELRLDGGKRPLRIAATEAVILSNTEEVITELPCGSRREGQFLWFFFNDRALAQAIPLSLEFFARFHSLTKYPVSEHVIRLPHAPLTAVLHSSYGLQGMLAPMLTAIFNSLSPGFAKLCLNRIIIPRIRMLLFLERLVLKPRRDHDSLLAGYPGGKNALRREMTRLAMPSVAHFVTERRKAIHKKWLEQGVPEVKILAAFHVKTPGRIIRDPGETHGSKRRAQKADAPMPCDYRYPHADSDAMRTATGCTPGQPQTDKTAPVTPESDAVDFGNTGITEFLSPEILKSIPGLEDLETLLQAA